MQTYLVAIDGSGSDFSEGSARLCKTGLESLNVDHGLGETSSGRLSCMSTRGVFVDFRTPGSVSHGKL